MQVTLVAHPGPYNTALDTVTGIRFVPGVSVEVADAGIKERLESLRALGYEFTFTDTPAAPDPDVAPDPADLTPPAPAAPPTPAADAVTSE